MSRDAHRIRACILLAGAVATIAGCRLGNVRRERWITVACLGDSNTEGGSLYAAGDGWCEQLERRLESPPWRTLNRGRSGATACRTPRRPESPSAPLDAEDMLERTLEQDRPDVVILAFGTNDVILGCDAEATLAAYRRMLARIALDGREGLVALVPPFLPPRPRRRRHPWDDRIDALNERLRREFRSTQIVDFASGMERADYFADGVHIRPSGQLKRAEATRAALARRRP